MAIVPDLPLTKTILFYLFNPLLDYPPKPSQIFLSLVPTAGAHTVMQVGHPIKIPSNFA